MMYSDSFFTTFIRTNIIDMKKILLMAVIACASLLVSCEKEEVPHTGDVTAQLYGVWALTTKSEITDSSSMDVDYTENHFYLTFSEFPFPHAIAKKGSLTNFDLDDVDVDGVRFTYDASQKKISFKKTLWLSDGFLSKSMRLSGTYDVVELSATTLILQQTSFGGKKIAYKYIRQE